MLMPNRRFHNCHAKVNGKLCGVIISDKHCGKIVPSSNLNCIIRLSKGLKFSYQFTWPKKRSLKEPASSSGAIFDATVWQFLFLSLLTFRLLKIGPLNKMSNKSYTTVYLLTHASNSLQPLLDQGHLW